MKVRTYKGQRAGLTRARNKAARLKADGQELHARKVIVDECIRAVAEWESEEWAAAHNVRRGCWPDNWHSWNVALRDAYPVFQAPELDQLVGADPDILEAL